MKKTKMKKLVSLITAILCLSLLLTTLTISALDYSEETSSQTPDLAIGSKDELVEFANRVNSGETFEGKLVVLTADIDLENMAWTPIGYDSYGTSPEDAVSFNGTFDGRGHTISNLTDNGYVPTIVTSGEYGFGLFGYAYGASFKNVKLANVNIHADGLAEGDGAGVAALVGYYRIKNGTPFVFENCHLESGSIYATNNMGGLVGYMYGYALSSENNTLILDGRFVNCTNSATVTTKLREAGGIVGLLDTAAQGSLKVKGDLLFESCKNYGDITANSGAGNSCAGGILGRDNTGALWYFGGRVVFESCYNNGTITAYGNPGDEIHASGIGTVYNVGGLTAAVKNCVNEGEVYTIGSDVAFCGEILACSGYATIENCTVTDYSKLYGGVSRMLFIEQPGVEINEENARALLYLNGAAAPKTLTFGLSGGQAEKNIVHKENYFFDGWYTSPDFSGASVTFNNGGNDSGIFYAKFITLEEAYANTADGGTLAFEADVSDKALVIDKNITIDLGGFTYNLTAALARTTASGLQILDGNNVTIKNGTISSDTVSVLIDNYANLTLENVTLDGRELAGEKEVLSVKAGATTLKDSTVLAASDGKAINVCDVDSYENASVAIENSTVSGNIELTDYDDGEFTGKLTAGEDEITETGTYVQYETNVFFRMDTYSFTLTTDKTEMQANDTVTVTVSIDKDYYSAEYTFTYDTTKFFCADDSDNDGIIYVTNLYRGTAADLATYTLVAKNDISSVSTDNVLAVDGNVIQYKEQLINEMVSTVVGDEESIKISLDYDAEIKADYVSGYSLVLVFGADAGYSYSGANMFYVDAYGAYATLVEGAVTDEMIDAALAKSAGCQTITPSYDVNCDYVDDSAVDLKDATTVYACSALDFSVSEFMNLYLRADVNGDFVVNMVDINAVTANYTE